MKKWIAKKLLELLSFQWRKNYLNGDLEILVKLGDSDVLLLKAYFDGEKWIFEKYN